MHKPPMPAPLLVFQIHYHGGDQISLSCTDADVDKLLLLKLLYAATQSLLNQLAVERGPAKPGIVIARPMG